MVWGLLSFLRIKDFVLIGLVIVAGLYILKVKWDYRAEVKAWKVKYEQLQAEYVKLKNQCAMDVEELNKRMKEVLKRASKPIRFVYVPVELPQDYKEKTIDEQSCRAMMYLVDKFIEEEGDGL